MSASTLRTAFIVVGGLAIFFGWGLTGGFEFLMNRDSGSDRRRVEAAPRVLSATECDRLDEDWKSARFAAAALDEIVQSEHSQGRRGGDALEGQSRAVAEMDTLLDQMEAGGCL